MNIKINDYIKNLFPDNKDYKEIIKGTFSTFSFKVLGLVFSYLFNIILARMYGAEAIGVYTLSITLVNIFMLLGLVGTKISTVRFIAENAINKVNIFVIYKNVLYLILPLTFTLTLMFYLNAQFFALDIFHKIKLVESFRFISLAVLVGAFSAINLSVLRGLKKISIVYFLEFFFPPLIRVIILILISFFVIKSYLSAIYAYLISVFLVSILSLLVLRKNLHKYKKYVITKLYTKKYILKTSFPMLLSAVAGLIMGWTDVIMLGLYTTNESVGIYKIALKMASFITFPLIAVNSILGPKLAELYWNKQLEKIRSIVLFSSKLILFIVTPIILLFIIYSKNILNLFGAQFIVGEFAFIILAIGQFVNVYCGPIGLLMDMTGKQKTLRNIMFMAAILNIILNMLFIPIYKYNGAAIASTISIIFWNFYASFIGYKKFGFWVGYVPKILRR